ncbi:hypothetical protein [Nocardia sp. CC227C]|uniref:hypothetical protein n=1 Tax=Nocardia sp. CC227C TaxID=3044562 RepID=UPI00278C6DBB|nr:hypothetical protein [Nocardia sp. CC227C]
MSDTPLNATDIQLYLLKTMKPPEALLAAALDRIDCSLLDMQQRSLAVAQALKPGSGSVQEVRHALDSVLSPEPNDVQFAYSTYRLPLWPEFDFILTFNEPMPLIKRAEFLRRSGNETGRYLTPWKFVEGDMHAVLKNVRDIDAWGHYRSYIAYDARDGGRYFLRFGWGLLQEVSKPDA